MFEDERIGYLCSYFALEHKRKTRSPLTLMGLLKYVAFFEFDRLETTGKPPLNLVYNAWKWGPVAKDIYDKVRNNVNYQDKFIKTVFHENKGNRKDDEPAVRIDILSKLKREEIDLDFFSKAEVTEMERLIEIFADKFVTAMMMSDASHEAIAAWKLAWKRKEDKIALAYTFEGRKGLSSLAIERFEGFKGEEQLLGVKPR